MSQLTLVTGAGGFIGGHLVRDLIAKGVPVRAVDKKPLDDWYIRSPEAENQVADLQLAECCERAVNGVAHVYNLACDMGGMGFIENNKARCMLSVLISTHMLLAARNQGVERFFYSSSACIYPAYRQTKTDVKALKESDAYPADCEDGYGWEKLFTERLCRNFCEDFGIKTRIGRYHNVYGPFGTWDGGREKAPAAISRKVALAVISGKHEIEIWGDGQQTRSFMYIDDCLYGTQKLLRSDIDEPVNIGSDELVTINKLVDVVEEIAGVKLKRNYNLDAPKGVRGRNSDNTLIKAKLGWAPAIGLRVGMEKTYRWVYDQAKAREEGRPFIAAAA
ncbi:MAG TPA: NAD-dependent epimerase/dehydratase family protein [Candidatus Binataceae bacterium]|nr:NAD-dependent epimerase/dehydratase family protein [Candidatus Binataceae bacterium]